MEIYAIIPCLDEEGSISHTIDRMRAAVPAINIYVIDNGSQDKTISVAKAHGASVVVEPRQGKGFAVHSGFNAIPETADAILMVDGDDTYGYEEISQALTYVLEENIDMVVGKRVGSDESGREFNFRRGHRFGNKLLTLIYQKLFGININDTLSGWRLMSLPFIKSFPGSASSFEIEAELNVHAYNLNSKVREVNCSYKDRVHGTESKLRTYKDGWLILKRNFSLYRNERPGAAFKLLGVPWLTISMVLTAIPLIEYVGNGQVSRFPSLIAGVGAFIIATNLWVTGMILERVRLQRILNMNYRYSDFAKSSRI